MSPSEVSDVVNWSGAARTPSLARKRKLVSLVGATALVASAVAVGVSMLPEPAEAQVVAATEALSAYDSGVIHLVVDLDEPVDGTTSHDEILYRFDGDSASFEPSDSGDFEVTKIGDDVYSRGFLSYDSASESAGRKAADFLLVDEETAEGLGLLPVPVNPAASTPENILRLIQNASDFEQVASDDLAKTFSGSIDPAALVGVDIDDLPAGLTFFGNIRSVEHMPESIHLEVIVVDGVLRELKVITGAVPVSEGLPEGYPGAVITTTFSEYGTPQDIVPPEHFVDVSTDQIRLNEIADTTVWNKFLDATPAVCEAEMFGYFRSQDPDVEVWEPLWNAFSSCLIAEGRADVAEAVNDLFLIDEQLSYAYGED